jgi:protease-4
MLEKILHDSSKKVRLCPMTFRPFAVCFHSLLLSLALVTAPSNYAAASVPNENIERQFSVSQSYDSRNVFTNPAAFGFESALNGPELLGAFQYGFNHNVRDDLAFSLSYGVLGFGAEQLTTTEGPFGRYGMGIGLPVGPWLYVGAKFSNTYSDVPSLNGVSSLDAGLQMRPSNYWALGFTARSLNQPTVGNVLNPVQYSLGLTLRPWGTSALELSGDVSTTSINFGQNVGYLGMLGVEPWKGLRIRAGYSQRFQFQAGLQIDFEHASLFANGDGAVVEKPAVVGVQFSSKAYASALNPPGPFKLEIESTLSEEPVEPSLFMGGRRSSLEILEALDKARRDPKVSGILLKLDTFPLGLAAAGEFFEALWKVRETGKTIDVYLQNASIKEYLVASAATTIHLEPTAELRFLGVHSERYYVKGTLDKLGVEGEFLAKGEFKSAPEMFTRKQSSPVNHEATLEELKTAQAEIVALLAKSGRIDAKKWAALIERGLLSAEEAKEWKLVDNLDYFSQDLEKIKKSKFVRSSIKERKNDLALSPKIAVIVASGDILGRKVGALSLGGYPVVTPDKIEKYFKRAIADPLTHAILLRVDSPGGEIVASDEIAALVTTAREKKTVYVSMGDVAASGGYFISAPAERIFASPLTVTGSIGVFLGKFSLAGLYKKLDLTKEILGYSPYPGIFSEDRGWSNAERGVLTRRLDQYYASFVNFVSVNRRLTSAEAEASAKGRVWFGRDAGHQKLVDDSGGFLEALAATATRVNLKEGEFETWVLEANRGLFEFDGPIGALSATGLASEFLPHPLRRSLRWAESLRDSPFLFWNPASVDILSP